MGPLAPFSSSLPQRFVRIQMVEALPNGSAERVLESVSITDLQDWPFEHGHSLVAKAFDLLDYCLRNPDPEPAMEALSGEPRAS